MDTTARFALPQIAPGQLQKEWAHNEALHLIDSLLCPVVEDLPSATPPSGPALGACHIVGAAATGAWAGQDGNLACYTEGGWRFVAPTDGMAVINRSSGELLLRRSENWESGIGRFQEIRVNGQTVLRGRQPPIGDPSGGSVVDSECRSAATAILAAMRIHGLIG